MRPRKAVSAVRMHQLAKLVERGDAGGESTPTRRWRRRARWRRRSGGSERTSTVHLALAATIASPSFFGRLALAYQDPRLHLEPNQSGWCAARRRSSTASSCLRRMDVQRHTRLHRRDRPERRGRLAIPEHLLDAGRCLRIEADGRLAAWMAEAFLPETRFSMDGHRRRRVRGDAPAVGDGAGVPPASLVFEAHALYSDATPSSAPLRSCCPGCSTTARRRWCCRGRALLRDARVGGGSPWGWKSRAVPAPIRGSPAGAALPAARRSSRRTRPEPIKQRLAPPARHICSAMRKTSAPRPLVIATFLASDPSSSCACNSELPMWPRWAEARGRPAARPVCTRGRGGASDAAAAAVACAATAPTSACAPPRAHPPRHAHRQHAAVREGGDEHAVAIPSP